MTEPGAPIGVFDSGVGGLTVARAIMDQLPAESIRYLGDTAHGPYGPQPIAEVRAHALAAMDQLVDSGVKMLVVACNSASAACLRDARERYDVPVVEVILPAVRRAIAATRTGRVGVIGTQTTVRSRAYEDAFAAAPLITITSAACPSFVDFVERGITSGRQILGLAQSYLEPLQRAEVDTLVLGCTHYPMLMGAIGHVMGESVTLVSSADETAKDVFRVLTEAELLRDPGEFSSRSTAGGASVLLHRRSGDLPSAGRALPGARGRADRETADQGLGRRARRDRSAVEHRPQRHPDPNPVLGWQHSGTQQRNRRMKLTIVGCSGSMPGIDSAASCYLIEGLGTRIVVDLGSGSIGPLQRYVALETIDAIVISHLHADHCLDACAFVVWHRYSERSRGLMPLYGPAGTRERLAAAYERPESDLDDVFDFHELDAQTTVVVGDLRLSFARMNHPVETYAVRVDGASTSITYSADTGVCAGLVTLASGSDVLLCEAARPDGDPDYPTGLHLTGSQAGEHAAAAGVGRLLLTHIPPWVDPAAQLASARTYVPTAELVSQDTSYEV